MTFDAIMVVSGVLWTLTYVLIIRQGFLDRTYGMPLAALGGGPEAVAETIERAISAARPRARYTVTPSARLLISTRRLLPDRAWDGLVGLFYPRPGG